MKNSRSKLKIISIIILVLLTSVFCVKKYIMNSKEIKSEEELIAIYEQKVKEANELINVDEISDEFIDNYFEEVSKLTQEEKENLLIVISKEKVGNSYGAKKIIEAPNNNYYLVYDSDEEKNNAYEKLEKNSDIISVEENAFFYDAEDETNDTPINIEYNSWAAEQLGYDNAINKINEIKSKNPDKINEVGVAVIDSGLNITEFPEEYQKKVKTYDATGVKSLEDVTDVSKVVGGYNNDQTGHGTHVAGIIAENTPDNVNISVIRVNRGEATGGDLLAIIAGINYATIELKVDVISLSLGIQSTLEQLYNENKAYFSLTQTITSAYNENIVVVAASGNNNKDEIKYPALLGTVMSIGAVDSRLERTEFSNYGVGLDFVAPGFNIKSLNQKVKMGTSQATPHASAAVAILKSLNKDITLEQSINLLQKYAIDIGDDGLDEQYGNGVINFNGVVFCGENIDKECDEYGVFEKNVNINTLTTKKIQANGMFTTEYNYGNLTNIMNAEINLYYTSDDYYTKTLAQIDDNIEIIGYNPSEYTLQDVTVNYKNYNTDEILTTTLIVDNRQIENKDIDWNFTEKEDGTIELTKINYPNVSDVDLDTYCITTQPQIVYIPNQINGKQVTSLGEKTFQINFSPGNMLRYFCTLKKVYVPKDIKEIGKDAFSIIRENKKDGENNPGPLEIIIPETVEIIDDSAFEIYEYEGTDTTTLTSAGIRENIKFYIYNNEYAKEYADSMGIEYGYLNDKHIDIDLSKFEFTAFDEITFNDLSIETSYVNKDETKKITESIDNFEIKYTDGNTSLRYGDESFMVSFYTDIGHYIEKEVTGITVNKIKPEYEIPNDLTATIGETLSEIKLPEGFRWKDDTVVLNKLGEKVFEAIYEPADKTNYETIELEIPILVNIKYTSESNTVKHDGKSHGISINIEKPNNAIIKYIDEEGNYTLDEMPKFTEVGEYIIKFRIFVGDEYQDGEEILRIVNNLIINNTKDYETMYNGENHSLDIKVELDDYDIKYSIDDKNYNLDSIPMFKDVGEYTVNYKIIAENYDDLYGTNKVKIYGIKSFDTTIKLNNDVLIVKDYNNNFKKISSRINVYSPKYEFNHYDKDNKKISTDNVKTGEKINININNKKDYNYIISVLGDVNGDGKINYLDYVSIYNHIYKIKHIESDKKLLKDEYLLSADTSLDGKVNYLDYVKIYNKIKEIKGGSR